MKIIRNGIEIELTGRELFDAHEEYQMESRKTDMRDALLEMFDDDDADNNYVDTGINVGDIRKVVDDDEWLEKAVVRFEKAIGRHDDYWDCYWRTAENVCKALLREGK